MSIKEKKGKKTTYDTRPDKILKREKELL